MDVEGAIINGYLRLYCKIKLPGKWLKARGLKIPKRCRVCYGELDTKYKARKSGYLCLDCYRAHNDWRMKLYYQQNKEKIKQRNKESAQRHPERGRAMTAANSLYKERQCCVISGCNTSGLRHHPDYSKPKEIIWLCPLHHTQLHRGDLTLSV